MTHIDADATFSEPKNYLKLKNPYTSPNHSNTYVTFFHLFEGEKECLRVHCLNACNHSTAGKSIQASAKRWQENNHLSNHLFLTRVLPWQEDRTCSNLNPCTPVWNANEITSPNDYGVQVTSKYHQLISER